MNVVRRWRNRRAERARLRDTCGSTVLAYDAEGRPVAIESTYVSAHYLASVNPERKEAR
jgi:hypothetical protein